MANYPHKHLKLPTDRKSLYYRGDGRNNFKLRDIERSIHAAFLTKELSNVGDEFIAEQSRRASSGLDDNFGLILDVKSQSGYELKFDSLAMKATSKKDGIYLLNVRTKETPDGIVTSAAILVPFGCLDKLEKKIADYSDPSKDKKRPSHAELLQNIQSIRVAALEALWTDSDEIPKIDDEVWWEFWVSRAPRAKSKKTWIQQFDSLVDELKIELNKNRLFLPENIVVLVKARRSVLEGSLDLLNTLTEIRKVQTCCLDLSDLEGPAQHEWLSEALTRIQWPEESAPAVCLLDTGVNRTHPLIENLLSERDLDTVIPAYGSNDHNTLSDSHGTPMAGIAMYDDLRNLLFSTESWVQRHRLESVKIIHNGDENDPDNYGEVTRQAILLPEINNPSRMRVYCMAITQSGADPKGRPSSWSAAIDSIVAGVGESESSKRLVFISAGNIRDFTDYSYPSSNLESEIENPAQSWNAITVGAMTNMTMISGNDDESRRSTVVGPKGGLSPFSRTSQRWDAKWPIKPDIVCEGGNMARSQTSGYYERESLEPISTSPTPLRRPFCNMSATSSATATASRLGAILMASMSGYRMETYRGLLVHSAQWTDRMLASLQQYEGSNKQKIQRLLRTYGFGVPNVARLLGSGESGVTMIIEDDIQPYNPDSKPNDVKLGYFNLHNLPWPKDIFSEYPDHELTLKVTLSYFIEPNPGSRCWDKSLKYRYASHLLRFTFKRSTERDEVFQKALEKQINESEQQELSFTDGRADSDPRWAIGPKLRGKAGSLVQDVWTGSPAELSQMDQVAVYPAKGWFGSRQFPQDHEAHDAYKKRVRYSLILSIDAKEEIGLYTSVSNLISISTEVSNT